MNQKKAPSGAFFVEFANYSESIFFLISSTNP